jgi:CDP-diacylglycerol--glycerol-3-phosphate 3-phosphatidyltransferase
VLGVNARPLVAKAWAPVVSGLVRAGVTADAVTLTGTLGAVASAMFLIGNGQLFWGAFAVTVFVLLDMLDGALARARGGGSLFGAVLDSTGDRAADAAIFGALAWWFSGSGDNRLIVLLALLCLVLGILTSYVKARAEGVGLACDVGVVERTERLILVLVGTGFSGLGIPYALHVALWVLLVGSAVTVGQRFVAVYRGSRGRLLPVPPADPSPPDPSPPGPPPPPPAPPQPAP